MESLYENKYVPKCDTYSLVVQRDSAWIAFLYAALNDLDILSCEISNTYLEAPCGEKLWTVASKEFGSLDGKLMIIHRALYGIKALSTTLSSMNFEPSRTDTDIWLRISTNLRGENYRECIVVHVGNLIAMIKDPKYIMDSFSMNDLKYTVIHPD